MRTTSILCVGILLASCQAKPIVAEVFPKAGTYHIITEVSRGSESTREEKDKFIDASDQRRLESYIASGDGAVCRNVQVDIGGGEFEVSMTCDAPEYRIRNMKIKRRGTYSKDSIKIAAETIIDGTTTHLNRSYQLN